MYKVLKNFRYHPSVAPYDLGEVITVEDMANKIRDIYKKLTGETLRIDSAINQAEEIIESVLDKGCLEVLPKPKPKAKKSRAKKSLVKDEGNKSSTTEQEQVQVNANL